MADVTITFRTKAELAEFRKFQGALKAGKKDLTSFQKASMGVTSALKGMAVAYIGIAGARAALNFIKESIDLAGKQEKAEVSRNAALKRQGVLTKANIRILDEHAKTMQDLTGTSDTLVISLQDLLLGFGVMADEIPHATQAAIDFAATADISVTEATRRLGRTMKGAIDDVSAFVPAVKDLTKAQLAAGDAIKLVGDALEGKAAAGMDSLEGQSKDLSNAMDDIKKSFGSVFIETGILGGGMGLLAEEFKDLADAINKPMRELAAFNRLMEEGEGFFVSYFALFDLEETERNIAFMDELREAAEKAADFSEFVKQQQQGKASPLGRGLGGLLGDADDDGFGDFGKRTPAEMARIRERGAQAARDAAHAIAMDKLASTRLGEEGFGPGGISQEVDPTALLPGLEETAEHLLALQEILDDADQADLTRLQEKLDERNLAERAASEERILIAEVEAERKKQLEGEAAAHIGQVGAELVDIMQMDQEAGNAAMQALVARQAAFLAAKGAMALPFPANLIAAPIAGALAHALIMSFHEGGIVGQGGQPLGGIALPPRRPDEVDTRLQKGEVVFSREDVARGGGAAAVNASRGQMGGGTPVVVNITTNDAKSIDDWFRRGDGQRAIQRAVDRGDLRLR